MTEPNSTMVAEQARARWAYPHVLDGAANPDRDAVIAAIAAALTFPSSFGTNEDGPNEDALYDGLTDLSWLPAGEHVLIWVGADVLKQTDPKGYLSIHGVLSDAQRATAAEPASGPAGHRLTVVLTQA